MVQLGGLEPPTSGSTIRRSNQLSYNCTLDPAGIGVLWASHSKSKALGVPDGPQDRPFIGPPGTPELRMVTPPSVTITRKFLISGPFAGNPAFIHLYLWQSSVSLV
jgi:hypothetical protein